MAPPPWIRWKSWWICFWISHFSSYSIHLDEQGITIIWKSSLSGSYSKEFCRSLSRRCSKWASFAWQKWLHHGPPGHCFFFFQGSKLSVVYRCPSLLESWRFPKMKVNHGKPPNHAKLDHLWPFQYWILLVMNQRIHVMLFHSISGCADVSHVDVFILQHPFSVTVFANNDWCGELHE